MLRTDSISNLPKILPDAPWHVRWKRKLRKIFLVSMNHPEVRMKKFLKSVAAVEKESRRQVKFFSPFIIHPLSEFRKYWNIFIFFLLFFHQMITPLAAGFIFEMEEWMIEFFIILDFVVCFNVFVEVLIKFRTGFIVKETNEIILDPKLIARKRLKGLIPDLFRCFPFISLAAHIIKERYGIVNDLGIAFMSFLYCFSFYRFYRIMEYFSSIPIMLNLSETETIVVKLFLRTIYLQVFEISIK